MLISTPSNFDRVLHANECNCDLFQKTMKYTHNGDTGQSDHIPIRQQDEILARLRHRERHEGLDPDYVTNAVKDVLLKLRPWIRTSTLDRLLQPSGSICCRHPSITVNHHVENIRNYTRLVHPVRQVWHRPYTSPHQHPRNVNLGPIQVCIHAHFCSNEFVNAHLVEMYRLKDGRSSPTVIPTAITPYTSSQELERTL